MQHRGAAEQHVVEAEGRGTLHGGAIGTSGGVEVDQAEAHGSGAVTDRVCGRYGTCTALMPHRKAWPHQ
jgi:hypothetical protein